jgi:hypothetical protein
MMLKEVADAFSQFCRIAWPDVEAVALSKFCAVWPEHLGKAALGLERRLAPQRAPPVDHDVALASCPCRNNG